MKLTMTSRALAAVALGAVLVIGSTGVSAVDRGNADTDDPPGREIGEDRSNGRANFEGRTIDLQQSWEDAQACHVAEDLSITCYRTEQAMDAALGLAHVAGGDYPNQANGFSSCGSSLKLYRYNYYGTPVLYLTVRGSWTTLSWFGFDNVTSSYRIGSCQSLLRSGSYGGGSTYPGPTHPWAMRGTMGWYWDNVVSSTYMY